MLTMKRVLLFLLLLLLPAGCREEENRPVPTPTGGLSVPTLLAAAADTAPDAPPTADIGLVETVVAATVRAHTFGAGPDDLPPTGTPAPAVTVIACEPVSSWPTYLVQAGDTLFRIARRTGSTVAELTAANCIDRQTPLQIGQTLFIPRLPATATPPPTPDDAGEGLRVVAFTVEPEVVDYDDEVTISWDVRNAGGIFIWSAQWGTDLLPASGSITVPVAIVTDRWAEVTFTLRAEDEANYDVSLFEYRRLQVRTDVSIDSFTVSPATAPSNGSVTVSWAFSGADSGLISWMPLPYNAIFETLDAALAPAGSLEVALQDEFYPITFRLQVADENGLWVTAETFVETTCPYTYFVADPARQAGTCPDGEARSVTGAYQPFERGFMVWASDNEEILVFVDGGEVLTFSDDWAGEPTDIDEEPPAGLFQPVRGFGLVWAGEPAVRAALGWALAEEANFELLKQQIDLKNSRYGVVVGARYLQLPDGRVVVFHNDWVHPALWAYLE